MKHEKYIEIAESKNLRLSSNSENIINAINRFDGYCPCKVDKLTGDKEVDKKYLCPCEDQEQEILENGKCHCGLFIRK